MQHKQSIAHSVSHAVDGITHCLRTQKHMRLHFTLAFVVMVGAIALEVAEWQLLVLLFSITVVIVAEMLNTGIEIVVDMIQPNYDPRAKVIKDVAAGSVLISSISAALIGVIIFLHSPVIHALFYRVRTLPHPHPWRELELVIESLIILAIVTLVWRMKAPDGGPNHEGPVSGRAAFAFFGMVVLIWSSSREVQLVAALLMVVLIMNRGQWRTYSLRQVVLGALLGMIVPGVVFSLAGSPHGQTGSNSPSPARTGSGSPLPSTPRRPGNTRPGNTKVDKPAEDSTQESTHRFSGMANSTRGPVGP